MMDVCTFNQSGNQMRAVSLSLPCDEMCEEGQISRRRGKDIRKPTLTLRPFLRQHTNCLSRAQCDLALT